MKVVCVGNKGSDLPSDFLAHKRAWCKPESEFNIDRGSEYVVYAISLHMGYAWFAIADTSAYYPSFYPSPLFDVTDNKLSKYWVFSLERGKDSESTYTNWVYPEWAHDPYYYDKLTDGDEKEVTIFKRYKKLMDIEFPDASVPENYTAIVGKEKGWLLCPTCLVGWESASTDGMVVCPQCKTVLHNPFFISR